MDWLSVSLFSILIVALLSIDLYQHRNNSVISTRSAISWVLFYALISFMFAGYIYFRSGADSAALFLTGWGLEKVLAIDNLIVFAAIFSYFNIKDEHQHRILYWGILGAIILRLVFVAIGVSLAHMIGSTSEIIFALIILYTAYLMLVSGEDDDIDYENAWYIRYTKRWLPVTHQRNGAAFFINGKATPLFFALITIEFSDIMFAFDSVPAIIAVTKEPFLIYSSMIFAILGLRSMYFVLSALTKQLVYLEKAVIAVLIFIAAKLMVHALTGFDIPPAMNLGIVMLILIFGALVSLIPSQTTNRSKNRAE